MAMRVPDLKNVYDEPIAFGWASSYKSGKFARLHTDFQCEPNERKGGYRVEFLVYGVGVDRKLASGGDSTFRLISGYKLPTLAPHSADKESNCGDPVVKADIVPIRGRNWHGWIAEETFAKARGRCKPAKEYTSRYRCMHVMVGSDKVTGLLDGVCLFRKRELSLESGLSYDIFMDMLMTLRLKKNDYIKAERLISRSVTYAINGSYNDDVSRLD